MSEHPTTSEVDPTNNIHVDGVAPAQGIDADETVEQTTTVKQASERIMKKTDDEAQTAVETPTSKLLLSKSPRLVGGARLATPPPVEPFSTMPKPPAPPRKPPLPAKPMKAARASTQRFAAPPPPDGKGPALGLPRRPPPPLPPPPDNDTQPIPTAPLQAPAPSLAPSRVAREISDATPQALGTSISGAFDAIVLGENEATNPDAKPGISSDADRAAVQGVFDELAANHVDQVRNVMLELQLGDVACSWIESTKSTLTSLRQMAAQMELDELCGALDAFTSAIDDAVASGQAQVSGERKAELLRRYERLIELIPTAFALDGERDTREPIIVESLLRQVDGVEKLTIDKLFAAGLSRLQALMMSNAGDLAAVSGVGLEVAARIAERFASYKQSVPTAVAAQDAGAERNELRGLLAELKRHHEDYEKAAAGWTNEHQERKRTARKLREQAFLRVRVVLARLGEAQRLQNIEKRPYHQRISDIDKYLQDMARLRPPPPAPKRAGKL